MPFNALSYWIFVWYVCEGHALSNNPRLFQRACPSFFCTMPFKCPSMPFQIAFLYDMILRGFDPRKMSQEPLGPLGTKCKNHYFKHQMISLFGSFYSVSFWHTQKNAKTDTLDALENEMKHTLNIPWTYSEHALNMLWTWSEHALNMPWTCSEHALNMLWTCSEHALNLL